VGLGLLAMGSTQDNQIGIKFFGNVLVQPGGSRGCRGPAGTLGLVGCLARAE